MRKYLLQLFVFAAIGAALNSCKLDKPVLPGDPGYVAAIPPNDSTGIGTGGGGTTATNIDTALLSGNWTVATTGIGVIVDEADNMQASPTNLFAGVTLINSTKISIFDGSPVLITTDTLAYTLSGNSITFATDPIGRTSNGPIQITKLTANAMTWLAPDPMIVNEAGHTEQAVYQFTFTR
jgi:hypothetical protein